MKCSVKNLRVTLHNLVQSSCNQSQSQSVSQSVCQPGTVVCDIGSSIYSLLCYEVVVHRYAACQVRAHSLALTSQHPPPK